MILPEEMYQPNYMQSKDAFLQVESHYLTAKRKDGFGFFSRILIWLGFSSASIVKITNLFKTVISSNDELKLTKLWTVDRSVEQIKNLVGNFIAFNEKVERHNRNIGFFSLRKAAAKVDEVFIAALANKTVKPNIVPPQNRLVGFLSSVCQRLLGPRKKEFQSPQDVLALLAPKGSKPPRIRNFGNTCHFDSAVNFLASLPPVVDVIGKNEFFPTAKRDDEN